MSTAAASLKAWLPDGVLRIARGARRLPRHVLVAALRTPAGRQGLGLIADLTFNPLDPAFLDNPYPTYRLLRERDPVHRSPLGFWVITRYADVAAILADPRFVHPDYAAVARSAPGDAFRSLRGTSVITMNPPDHTRVRRVLGDVFTPALVAALRPRVEDLADRLLGRLDGLRETDIAKAFAVPLPVAVISDLFGISFEDGMRCHVAVVELAQATELVSASKRRSREHEAARELCDYFEREIHDRRLDGRPGLVSRLAEAQRRSGALSDEELRSACVLMFSAGHETIVGFLGNAIATMATVPGVREALLDEEHAPRVVDELLRFDPPVQLFARQASEDVEFGGRRIRRGASVLVAVASANRDPAQFRDPDRLDFSRTPAGQDLSFGHGIHGCLGRALARLEGQVALPMLARRLPGLRLAARPVRRPTAGLRTIDRLHVAW